MTYDPGMDNAPERWTSPEIDPDFRDAMPQGPIAPENDENPVGMLDFPDANEMHRETLEAIGAQSEAMRRLIEVLTDVGKWTLRLDAGVMRSFSTRIRVRWLVMSRATAGLGTLLIGTESYPFTVGAVPVRIDLPIVIENGTDITFVGDGVCYLISDPE